MLTLWVALSFQVERGRVVQRMKEGRLPRRVELQQDSLDRAAAVVRRVQALGGRVVTFLCEEYPERLKHIPDPPAILYCLGPLRLHQGPMVAVVGPRRPSRYGLRMAAKLGQELGAAGVTVVSGMALGVDGAAQRAALDAGGVSIAVLGCGLDVVHPPSARPLHRDLIRRGLLVTEHPPGTPALRHHFPVRNRLISGLSQAVVIVEAGSRSGSLITARHATEQNRDLCAVPGEVGNPLAAGPLQLLQTGAQLVTCAADVLPLLGMEPGVCSLQEAAERFPPGRLGPQWLEPEYRLLWERLGRGPADANDLALLTGLPVNRVLAALAALEVHGLVQRLPDGAVHRIQRPSGG